MPDPDLTAAKRVLAVLTGLPCDNTWCNHPVAYTVNWHGCHHQLLCGPCWDKTAKVLEHYGQCPWCHTIYLPEHLVNAEKL